MSFFKSLFKSSSPPVSKPEQPPVPPEKKDEAQEDQVIPELYSGMKVEVLSPNNNLLFVGVLKIRSGGVLEICTETSDAKLPIAEYHQSIKLRGFQKNSQTFTLNGAVAKSSPDFWRIEDLKFLQSKDSRAFFRQNANVKAEISPDVRYRGKDQFPCQILDISAGGARLLCKHKFAQGDLFVLHVSLVAEENPFSMTCQVRHVSKKGIEEDQPEDERKPLEYGCQFVGIPEKEQERLLQAIFKLQRKILQSRRD